MRVLYLTHGCPYPPNKGDRIRNFHILKHLSQTHSVTLIYPSFSQQDVDQSSYLKGFCAAIHTVRLSPLLAKLKCCISLLGDRSLTNAHFYSDRLRRLIDEQEYDLAVVDCSSMAQYVLDVAQPKVIDFVDVDSDKWKLYASMNTFPKSWIYKREFKKLQDFEAKLVKEFEASVVISENEKQLLPQTDRLFVVRNGIDLEYFSPREKYDPDTMIFTGAMDYFPNIDAVAYFHEQIFPLIKKERPGAKFIIGGMNPAPRISALQSDDTFVTGFVPDMREYLGRAAVCVVPLRIAKGVQNKVLEAMAMGVPVVSTSSANEGIHAIDQRDLVVADDPSRFADSVIQILENNERAKALAQQGRIFVERNFAWEENLRQIDLAIQTAMSGGMGSEVVWSKNKGLKTTPNAVGPS